MEDILNIKLSDKELAHITGVAQKQNKTIEQVIIDILTEFLEEKEKTDN